MIELVNAVLTPVDNNESYNILNYDKRYILSNKQVVFYASNSNVRSLKWFKTLKNYIHLSCWLLTLSTVAIILYWNHLNKSLNLLNTWLSLAVIAGCLVQASAFCNSWIVYHTVIMGRIKPELHITLAPDATGKENRQQLLFIEALCKGSYTISFVIILFITIITAYLRVVKNNIFDTYGLSLFLSVIIPNLISFIVLYYSRIKTRRLIEYVE